MDDHEFRILRYVVDRYPVFCSGKTLPSLRKTGYMSDAEDKCLVPSRAGVLAVAKFLLKESEKVKPKWPFVGANGPTMRKII